MNTTNSFLNIATNTTTTVKSGSGVLKRIILNKPLAGGVITIYDQVTATGTKIGTITLPGTLLEDGMRSVEYDCAFGIGLTVVTSAATDITVVYR